MKAVNLIPADAGRARSGTARLPQGPAYVVIALLGVAVLFVTIYVLTNNTIAERRAKLANLKVQVVQAQARAASLANYASFAKMAQTRMDTVRQIAESRFDWHAALADLSKVVPPTTSLESLSATVTPGVTASSPSGGGGGGGTSTSLRADISAPAFELTGCSDTQDDVARLMSRLRLINGVTRVTLGDSQKQEQTQSAASPTGSAQGGCPSNAPQFDLVVFFKAVPGLATAPGGAPAPGGPAGTQPVSAQNTPAGASATAHAAGSPTTGTTTAVSATPGGGSR